MSIWTRRTYATYAEAHKAAQLDRAWCFIRWPLLAAGLTIMWTVWR